MGTDKATLCLAGEPLWSRQLKLLQALGPQVMWISARRVLAWCPTGMEVVLDVGTPRGPLSGISACLDRVRTTHLLVLAIDMPQMTVTHLRKICGLVAANRGLIPCRGDFYEPLCAVYPKSAAPFATQALAGQDFSLQRFSRVLVEHSLATAYPLSAQEERLYRNVNRPEDY